MKKDEFKTDVIFRKFKSYGNDPIIALFPYGMFDYRNITSYQHIGQHGGADYESVLSASKPAKENEYKDLKTELESLGYNLNVIKRRNYDKYLKSYYEVRNG